MHETFWSLFQDAAHWEFELFLMLLFDGLIFGLAWPFLRKHYQRHTNCFQANTIFAGPARGPITGESIHIEPPHRANEGWTSSRYLK